MQSFFPRDVLDGIWDLIESVSEAFLSYSPCFFSISTIINDFFGSLFASMHNLSLPKEGSFLKERIGYFES